MIYIFLKLELKDNFEKSPTNFATFVGRNDHNVLYRAFGDYTVELSARGKKIKK